jgi:hypothetical protein
VLVRAGPDWPGATVMSEAFSMLEPGVLATGAAVGNESLLQCRVRQALE